MEISSRINQGRRRGSLSSHLPISHGISQKRSFFFVGNPTPLTISVHPRSLPSNDAIITSGYSLSSCWTIQLRLVSTEAVLGAFPNVYPLNAHAESTASNEKTILGRRSHSKVLSDIWFSRSTELSSLWVENQEGCENIRVSWNFEERFPLIPG